MAYRNIHRILVIKLRHIGDVLLTVPVFRALRKNFPDARISALVNSGTEDVLSGHPCVDEIMVFDRKIKNKVTIGRYADELSFLKTIRGKRFDMAVDLTSGDRAALISFLSGAKYRLAYDPGAKGFRGKRLLYSHRAARDSGKHMVFQNIEVIRQFGIAADDLSVDFFVPEVARRTAFTVLSENNIHEKDRIVHIHPTSRWLFKCWKDEFMAEIIQRLLDMDMAVVVTSSAEQQEIEKTGKILSMVGKSPRLIDLRGKTSIKEVAAVAEQADLFFGVDSAPMHIAAAVGTPVVALFGPSGAFNWGPWDNHEESRARFPYPSRSGVQVSGMHTVIQKDWGCIPCGRDGCGGSKKSDCLESIEVDEVIGILADKLNCR
jgi:heptosyltransferase-3